MTISATLVKELRELTGVGMMECKKALEEAKGNLNAAVNILRKSGQAKAAKKVDRIASEGTIVIKISSDRKKAFMLEINCETDFAARDHAFLEFADVVAIHGLNQQITNLESLMKSVLDKGQTVTEMRDGLISKIGENINIRRIKFMGVAAVGIISSYIHGNKIGVLIALSIDNAELGKDLAMHIVASKPSALLPDDLPQKLITQEKEIYLAQLKDSGKPPEILEKIVAGRIQKFINESVLIKQPFVKDPDLMIEDLLRKSNVKVIDFIRFEVGEGIEKKATDFAQEVEAQVKSKQ